MYLGALGLITTVLVGSTISYIVFKMYGHSPNNLPKGVLYPAIDDLFIRNHEENKNEKSINNSESSKL